MKKAILLLLAAMALPVSAASIDWILNTGGSSNYMVGEDGNKLTGTAYLMLVDDVSSATFTSEQDIINLAIGGSDGAISITDGVNKTKTTATDNRLTAPTEYTFTVLVFDSSASSYYVADASNKTYAAYNLGASVDNYGTPIQASFNAKELYATSALRGTQTYTPLATPSVPEPSSAALALAGLALLLKRRRA